MHKIDYSRGPFGSYEKHTGGHLLNALCHWGIPLTTVETLRLTGKGEIKDSRGQVFARYVYFDGLEQPLFYFTKSYDLMNHQMHVEEDGTIRPLFRLRLSPHQTPGLIIDQDELATPTMYSILLATLTNHSLDPWYQVHKDACAFFQGGAHDKDGKYFYIEFANSRNSQLYVDKLNAEYVEMAKTYKTD